VRYMVDIGVGVIYWAIIWITFGPTYSWAQLGGGIAAYAVAHMGGFFVGRRD